jgi:hypothetical protein
MKNQPNDLSLIRSATVPYMYIYSTFGSKVNKFERKKSEKNEKIAKALKVAGNYPNI